MLLVPCTHCACVLVRVWVCVFCVSAVGRVPPTVCSGRVVGSPHFFAPRKPLVQWSLSPGAGNAGYLFLWGFCEVWVLFSMCVVCPTYAFDYWYLLIGYKVL